MSKRDVLDSQLAGKFAWRIAMPTELAAPPPPEPVKAPASAPPPSAPPQASPEATAAATEAADKERWARADRECAELARKVDEAWQISDPATQAAATAALLDRARKLGLDLFGMSDYPLASVRLWRLVVRHYQILPARERKPGVHALSFAAAPPDQRETVDLLVEVAETGDSWLAFMMERGPACEAMGRRHPELGARLARVLDHGKTWAARETAARWLSFADLRAAIPSLRRALRRPHARVRWFALEILLERAPRALSADDVQWLLEDAVDHPLPHGFGSRSYETAEGYADTLVTAVAKVRPPEGWRPLSVVADGGGVHIRRDRAGLDMGWALRALAAGYPERALSRIDRELAGTRSWRRMEAVEAAGQLPDELLRPRLLEAAKGPSHRIIERAKALWFERFGSECPVDALAGVWTEVLAEPPGDRFLSRLTVLRGASDEAKGAMLAALLAEAPVPGTPAVADGDKAADGDKTADGGKPAEGSAPGGERPEPELSVEQREILALLLYSLREQGTAHRRTGLPNSEEAWAEAIVQRFGHLGFEGLAALSERGAMAGVDHEWLGALAGLARRNVLKPSWHERLRTVAVNTLRSPGWDGATSPLIVLTQVGAPPDLIDQLWSLALEPSNPDGPRLRGYTILWASDALVGMKDAPALDARIAAEGEAALVERRWERLERISRIGCRRRLPAAYEIARRGLALGEHDAEARPTALQCAHNLAEAKQLDPAWVLAMLQKPESPSFTIASRFVGEDASPEVIAAIEQAMTSPARDGAAAAESARALLWRKRIGIEDPRLDGLLEGAPPRARADLLGSLVLLDAPFAPLRRHYHELLLSSDEESAAEAFEDLYVKQPEGTWELLEEVRPLVKSEDLRESITYYLREPTEADLYWRHSDEDEDEDEDEDLDDLLDEDTE
ncbi:hypothetical protein [Chondromyces apiculatus]|uniref:Uncharacterized protein n=1 Tax=Chondromyces apiculatus DSM 436 TaxID=1192034 RepID=A0A017T127_9BACT|nr:hypothetical protein [Chondromyces apiculatus]EYF02266.1 Hypothetical protein CAP_7338 [Chondromyces apiculatus DSM 436]